MEKISIIVFKADESHKFKSLREAEAHFGWPINSLSGVIRSGRRTTKGWFIKLGYNRVMPLVQSGDILECEQAKRIKLKIERYEQRRYELLFDGQYDRKIDAFYARMICKAVMELNGMVTRREP